MGDFFVYRDSLEPESDQLGSTGGGGMGPHETPELEDYRVEARDGEVGKVADSIVDDGAQYLLVMMGGTLLTRKEVVIPAGLVERIDRDKQTVYIDRTKDEIKKAPDFDETRYRDPAYREELARYYGQTAG